jgi:hypothetical protein
MKVWTSLSEPREKSGLSLTLNVGLLRGILRNRTKWALIKAYVYQETLIGIFAV